MLLLQAVWLPFQITSPPRPSPLPGPQIVSGNPSDPGPYFHRGFTVSPSHASNWFQKGLVT